MDEDLSFLQYLQNLKYFNVLSCRSLDLSFLGYLVPDEMENLRFSISSLPSNRWLSQYLTSFQNLKNLEIESTESSQLRSTTNLSNHGVSNLQYLTNLTDLKFVSPDVTDDGLHCLQFLTSLRSLDIQCSMTDEGLPSLRLMSQLSFLNLKDYHGLLTWKAVEALKKHLGFISSSSSEPDEVNFEDDWMEINCYLL